MPDAALLERFNIAGPRYTSYPTADRFVEAFGHADLEAAYVQRCSIPALANRPLSMYIHIPFCEALCYYCACNKIITKHKERAAPYLVDLERELALVVQQLRMHTGSASGRGDDGGRAGMLSQLHFGGGSPTFLSDEQLTQWMARLREHFDFTPDAEVSIEVDPRTVNPARLQHLRALGFNRLSFGVQDFDAAVQEAVHRVQSTEQVFELVHTARQLAFESINVDLIYGLPGQSQASFGQTLQTLVALKPDRVALYAYAHLPERFKPQRRIDSLRLPSADEKVALQALALQAMNQAGYVDIGMDHFALPDDGLAAAKRKGLLHRNFQGYSTQPDTDLIGLGVSSISKIGATYSQNAKDIESYRDALEQGHLPVVRGLALSRDDLMRRDIIMGLMCQGVLDIASIEQQWMVDFASAFAREWAQMRTFESDGLVQLSHEGIEVTAKGWTFVRAIAMVFDRYLQEAQRRAQFSKIL
ncbi:oxygen-independent coproporphyrinogen III oxidase [Lampropedia puyangensis]|uniref:Coproporphyrinogen-III oxidase n=1 Tax=Lampropedia puyangensis TaxID=1330072 RepID=A0A4S8EYF3_9BURK|nr:oxygen-independent coproporphyrinogen III oxidase [Lampropedia puyangensis]THT98703.1 oxygen-independent coproporphyrinogen III oxidase [Lampropedia puyangensis]